MSPIEIFRHWFEHEKASNTSMLSWFCTVNEEDREDPRFRQALGLAGHLSACRENWLDAMLTGGKNQVNWWPAIRSHEELQARFEAMEVAWTKYLSEIADYDILRDFDYWWSEDKGARWNIEGQLMQLVGHSFYHRGQIALLLTQLGGKPTDTDYLYWRAPQEPERWPFLTKDIGAP